MDNSILYLADLLNSLDQTFVINISYDGEHETAEKYQYSHSLSQWADCTFAT